MNKVAATITNIESVDTVNIVSFDVKGQTIQMMALELDAELSIGSKVIVGAKATNVVLAKEKVEQISISNQLEVSVAEISMGTLLCSVTFDLAGELWESLITRESALRVGLSANEKIVALIKSSELSIIEVVV